VTNITASSNVKEAQIRAVVIRADGTREDLGTISYFHKNPLRRWFWRLKEMLRG
jgi:hypothetical protein